MVAFLMVSQINALAIIMAVQDNPNIYVSIIRNSTSHKKIGLSYCHDQKNGIPKTGGIHHDGRTVQDVTPQI
jgi:hypothetical protein